MKTQIVNTQLSFRKSSLVELNSVEMKNVDSGITPGALIFWMATGMAAGVAIGGATVDVVTGPDNPPPAGN